MAIIRVEQLYPFPHKAFAAELKQVPQRSGGRGVVPGRAAEPGRLVLRAAQHPREHAGRPEARLRGPRRLGVAGGAATSHLHQEQQKALVDGAFAKLKGFVLTK